jgi:hypothetical protein
MDKDHVSVWDEDEIAHVLSVFDHLFNYTVDDCA